jgi:hypothetical protein
VQGSAREQAPDRRDNDQQRRAPRAGRGSDAIDDPVLESLQQPVKSDRRQPAGATDQERQEMELLVLLER